MSHCFLLGSKRDPNHKHLLKVIHYIEYLTYDFEKQRVDIVADFIIKNLSDKPACLVGIHRGNIQFVNLSDRWFDDEQWTSVLLDLTRDEIGLVKTDENELILCELDASPVKVQFVHGYLESWGPKPPNEDVFVPYVTWMSPGVKPGTLSLLRVGGCLRGQTYNHLLPDPASSNPITITGGKPLQEQIEMSITNDYLRYYRTFKSIYLDDPLYYHVFFERRGGRSLKTLSVSTDMKKVYVNERLRDGRHINWFWSDSDFNIYTLANGPVVELLRT